MPGIAADTRAGILEWLELQAVGSDAHDSTVFEQQRLIGRDEVRHPATLPQMPVQPEAAIHGVDHPVTAVTELAIGRGDQCVLHTRRDITDRPPRPLRSPAQPRSQFR